MTGLTNWRSPNGQTFQIAAGAEPVLEPFFNRLNQVYPEYKSAGGYAHRPKRTLDGRMLGGLSTHATGYTLDVKAPDPVLRQMAQEFPHLTWGGKFSHYDPVHFEFGPTAQKHGALPPLNPASLLDPKAAAPVAGPGPQPIAGGGAPMTPTSPMTPFDGMMPADVQKHRKLAQMLAGQATDASPVGHWTQALARVVQGGVGGMHDRAATEGERAGQASIAEMMAGNPTPQAMMANPYTQDMGKQLWLAQAKSKVQGPEEFGKSGAIFQGPDGRFYSMQFGSRGERVVKPVEVDGKPLTPAKGVTTVGDELINIATGAPVRNVGPQIAGREAQEQIGTARGKAEADLPRILDNASQALDVIDKIKKHPGKGWGVGFPGGAVRVPFTDQAGFVDLVEQTGGKAFLEAFNSLKGGGQITEAEGRKATEALARLRRDVKPEVFDAAIEDIRAVIEAGALRAQRSAGRAQVVPTPSPGMAPNPGGPPIRVNSPNEARRLPSGTPIMLPDGTIGKVP